MKIIQDGDTLCVSELEELTTANAQRFQTTVRAALLSQVKQIHIDLSATAWVDCGGIGALIALRKDAGHASPAIRLHNPPPLAWRIFQLTHADELFAIDGVASSAASASSAVLAAEAPKPISI